jgi:hypothetical protein
MVNHPLRLFLDDYMIKSTTSRATRHGFARRMLPTPDKTRSRQLPIAFLARAGARLLLESAALNQFAIVAVNRFCPRGLLGLILI